MQMYFWLIDRLDGWFTERLHSQAAILVHTLCLEKTPTHVFFYISEENVQIFQ